MRLRYIELFHAVLSTGSLTGAASLLNVSQPAASKALQQAENHLGFPLFSRVRGRLQPTPQALLMRHQIDKLMRDLYDLRRLALNITRPESHPLRVTCTPALAQVLVPDAIARLGEVYPETIVELFTQHSAVMCGQQPRAPHPPSGPHTGFGVDSPQQMVEAGIYRQP